MVLITLAACSEVLARHLEVLEEKVSESGCPQRCFSSYSVSLVSSFAVRETSPSLFGLAQLLGSVLISCLVHRCLAPITSRAFIVTMHTYGGVCSQQAICFFYCKLNIF